MRGQVGIRITEKTKTFYDRDTNLRKAFKSQFLVRMVRYIQVKGLTRTFFIGKTRLYLSVTFTALSNKKGPYEVTFDSS